MRLPFPASAGSLTMNVVPDPGRLSAVIEPPIMVQKRRQIASPSPVPPYFCLLYTSPSPRD